MGCLAVGLEELVAISLWLAVDESGISVLPSICGTTGSSSAFCFSPSTEVSAESLVFVRDIEDWLGPAGVAIVDKSDMFSEDQNALREFDFECLFASTTGETPCVNVLARLVSGVLFISTQCAMYSIQGDVFALPGIACSSYISVVLPRCLVCLPSHAISSALLAFPERSYIFKMYEQSNER